MRLKEPRRRDSNDNTTTPPDIDCALEDTSVASMAGIFCLPPTLRYVPLKLFYPLPTRSFSQYSASRYSMASTAPGRTYADAIILLNTLQSNRTVVASISQPSQNKNEQAIPEMLEWTRRAGCDLSHITQRGLRCIHVAGTKGKGSVCAMVEKVLLQYRGEDEKPLEGMRKQVGKIGLYTSPHLITVRERIKIDGSPISESLFARYFFELWDRFSGAASKSIPPHPHPKSPETKPGYFRYLTLLALHTFMEEGVKTAIVECGIGGEYDSTNILPAEAVSVTAITLLGIDHTGMLGDTIEEIAWHKAGIMKRFVSVFSVEQVPEAKAVLDERAREKGLEVQYIKRHPDLQNGSIRLGVEGDFQKDNASLAIAVASSHLRSLQIFTQISVAAADREEIPTPIAHALETVELQARCQVRKEGNIDWLIDGAHTKDSIQATAKWYTSKLEEALNSSSPPTATMLVFNQQDRDAGVLLRTLIFGICAAKLEHGIERLLPHFDVYQAHLPNFMYAAFCTNTPFKVDLENKMDLKRQEDIAAQYQSLDRNPLHMCYGSIEEAVELARRVSDGVDERLIVLVTGSLHLAGGVLEVLDSQKGNSGDQGIASRG